MPAARRPYRGHPLAGYPGNRGSRILLLITGWLTADPATLAPSFLAHVGHPACGLDALRADLDRFTFLLGGNDGEFLTGQDPAKTQVCRRRVAC